jgi:hypothetical protein
MDSMASSFNNTEPDIERYLQAAENEKYEADMVWETFNAFLLAQTIFLAFLLQSNFSKDYKLGYNLGTNIASLFGLLLCFPWITSFYRSMVIFNYRAKQARLLEPEGWNLLNDSIEDLHLKYYPHIPIIISKRLTTRCSVVMLIWLFILIYLILIFISSPWMIFISSL